MDELAGTMHETLVALSNEDTGRDLEECEELIQGHSLHEADITVMLDQVHAVNAQAEASVQAGHPMVADIVARQQQLLALHAEVAARSQKRKAELQSSTRLHQFVFDADELDAWVQSKTSGASSQDFGRDLTSVTSLTNNHTVLALEIKDREKSRCVPTVPTYARLEVCTAAGSTLPCRPAMPP